jgi:hypothetical protein
MIKTPHQVLSRSTSPFRVPGMTKGDSRDDRAGASTAGLAPTGDRSHVSATALLAALSAVPRINADEFRADLDAWVDQDPTPRA